MQRHFTALAILTVLLILAVGGGVYGLTRSAILESRQHATQATAVGIARVLSTQTTLLQQWVNTLAQSPSVVLALSSADPTKINEVAEQLQRYIPGAVKIRLILPEAPDQLNKTKPSDMGFADLDMARASFIKDPLPEVHELGINQHLAITAKVVKNGATIGVILASLNIQALKQSLGQVAQEDGYLRLMQGAVPLLEGGDVTLRDNGFQSFNVEHTLWRIEHVPAAMTDLSLQAWIAAMVAIALILTALCFFKAYHNFEAMFIGDRGMVLTAMKDLVNRRMHDIYPMSFKEMAFIVETLYALNQTVKRDTHTLPIDLPDETPYHFTDEPDDFFLSTPSASISTPADIIADTCHNAILSPIDLVASSNNSALDAIFNPGVIRGVVDKHLNKKLFHDLGCAVGSELQTDGIAKIVLGYDGRTSSPAFAEAFAQGVITTGCQVIDIGLVPISLMYDVALEVTDKFGVMITGGHSPGHINGLKLLIQGEPATDKYLHALKKRMLFEDYVIKTTGYIEKATRYSNEYLNKIAQDILLIKPLTVVVDCGNGVTSLFAPNLFKTLGCEVFELFCEIEGEFPHHLPDPSKTENLSDLMAAVAHYQADIGIAFDGDGDRLGVVDSAGRIISPEWLIQLFAKHILQAYPCTSIVYDDKCGKQLDNYIVQLGGNALPCKSGQLLSQLNASHALFAGDLSGRMIFNDRWMGLDDALYAAARLLEILSAEINGSKAMFNALAYDVKKT